MNLVEISPSGSPMEEMGELPAQAADIGKAYVALYGSAGFVRPWLGYFARVHGICIGTCGFKGPPQDARVEIAYFTFPDYEGRGYATLMARTLIARVWENDAALIVAAQTLPAQNASTSILKKLGFTLIGSADDPDEGEVWEWQLRNPALSGGAFIAAND